MQENNEIKLDNLDQFVEKLLLDKGHSNVDKEVFEQLKSDLKIRLDDKINAAIVKNMPEDKLDELGALLDKGEMSVIQTFCKANIKDLDQVVAEQLVSFRNIYLNL